MRYSFLILLSIATLSLFPTFVFALKSESDKAKIIFISKEGDNAKTYISKFKKGDLNSLKYELQRYNSGVGNEIDVKTMQSSVDGYIERISVSGEKKKNKSKRNKEAHDDLLGNYEVTDEESLLEVKVKKLKKIEAQAANKDDTGNFKKYSEATTRKNTTELSKYYKISSGKRLRDGHSITKPAGGIALIITYKIREGKNINTFVNVVEEYLNPGSTYYLKYHGNGSKRKYYLEYVPSYK